MYALLTLDLREAETAVRDRFDEELEKAKWMRIEDDEGKKWATTSWEKTFVPPPGDIYSHDYVFGDARDSILVAARSAGVTRDVQFVVHGSYTHRPRRGRASL